MMKISAKKGLAVVALALAVVTMAFVQQQKKIKVWLIGDSTMSQKAVRAFPEAGWGMPFSWFFDSTVVVDNRAQNGRSTKSFMKEGRWDAVMKEMNEGDWVLIQFGHNDEVPTKKNATTEDEFRNNLKKYVTDTREKKANPILITAVARRKFDAAGNLEDTHKVYSAIVRSVAAEMNVPLIDLDAKSQALLRQMGPDQSRLLYLHLEPGENPNYPDGKVDDTHFNEFGARKMAQIVLASIREQKLGLAERIVRK